MMFWLVLAAWLLFMVPRPWRRPHPVVTAVAVAVVAVVALVVALAGCVPAHADPAPPVPPGAATCHGQVVPLDPRVSVANPVGTLIFQAFLNAVCGPPPKIGADQ